MASHIAAGYKYPDNMTRKDHLAKIASLPELDAYKWWLTHCPKISRKAFDKARVGR